MKLALRQVTVKVKALSGPVHPKKSQRRKKHMKLAMTQVTVKVKALSGSVPYLFIVIRENEILMAVIRVSLFFLFVNRAREPPCTTLFIRPGGNRPRGENFAVFHTRVSKDSNAAVHSVDTDIICLRET